MFVKPLWTFRCAWGLAALSASIAAAQPATLYTPAASFNTTDHIVSATVFHWYTADTGQNSGPWQPLEGRANWTGDVPFWKAQIKDIMDANIQMMYVHLIPDHDQQRINLFQAASELRAQGYNVPKIAPFLDPPITWSIKPPIDLATTAGKDAFVDEYKRFYQEYYSVNTDAYADDYLAKFNNKPVLDTWHLLPENTANRTALTRADVESRLSAEFGAAHPVFTNGIYMVGTGLNDTYPTFADERLVQFETSEYFRSVTFNNIRTAQIKAGYWDQNIRDPGSFLPRDGGSHYTAAWQTANSTTGLRRVNVESWNEFDEGSGIYSANPGPPYIAPSNHSGNTDTWSASNNPRQYIDATAAGASQFNSIPDRDAKILYQDFPTKMYAGATRNVSVIVRNEGDNAWSDAQNYKFGQQEFQPLETMFGEGRFRIDDTQDEIPIYGGIFRGRPKQFDINIVAPASTGTYNTHWGMLQENVAWFGQTLTVPIQVLPKFYGDADVDGDVDSADLSALAGSWRSPQGADWAMGDFDSDHDVDRADFNLLAANYPGGAAQARAVFQTLVPHWAVNRSGDWSVASNWFGGVRNGIDATATFGSAISADQLVFTNTPVTLGTVTFDSSSKYLLTGLGSLTLKVSAGSGLIEVLQGAHKINLPLTIASDTELAVAGGASLLISDPLTIAAGKSLTQSGAGAVSFQSTVTLESGSHIALAGSSDVSVSRLAMSDNAAVDLGRQGLLVGNGDLASLESSVRRGYHGGDWRGAGITSSAAADDPARATALGIVADIDGIHVKYTSYGDTELNGVVDLADFDRFLVGYRAGSGDAATWLTGDFDYSGAVNADDFELFLRGLIHQPAPQIPGALFDAISDFARSESLHVDLTAIPEPPALGLFAVALIARRRHRA
jgi:hypothetical protein